MVSGRIHRHRLMMLAAPSLMAIPNFVHAQVFTAAPIGDYNNQFNWSPNATPGATTNVQIKNTTGTTATLIDGQTGLAAALSIGNSASTSGTLSLTSSATFTGAGNVVVGQGGGAGTLICNGTFTTTGTLAFGLASSTGTLIMSGGQLSTGSNLLAIGSGGSGTLLQSGGMITLPSIGTFGLGRGTTGYYDMEGGTLNVGGVIQMASGTSGNPTGIGTLILNNGMINGSSLITFAANGNATVSIGGGTLLATGGINLSNNAVCTTLVTQSNGYVGAGTLTVGVGSSTGNAAAATYNMSGGTLAVGTTMIIGGTGVSLANGTFNQSGGFFSVGGPLFVGDGTTSVGNSAGTMNVSGTGSVQIGATSTVIVGTTGSGTVLLCATAAGTSSLTSAAVGGGTIQIGSLISGANPITNQFLMGSTTIAGALPSVNVGTVDYGATNNNLTTTRLFSISSGTLSAGLIDLTSLNAQDGNNPNQATFQQLGGTVTATSMTFAGGVYQVGGSTAPAVVSNAKLTINPAGMAVFGVNSATYSGGGTIAVVGSLVSNGALTNNGAQLNIGTNSSTTVLGTVTFKGGETNSIGAAVKVWSGQLNMQTDGGANLSLIVADRAVIGGGSFGTIGSAIENLGTLSVLGGGVVRLNGTTAAATPFILVHTGTLSIKGDAIPTGTLDVAANDVIVDNADLSITRSQIISGRSTGTWTGPGIRSSAAAGKPAVAGVGYATVASIGTTTFDGVSGLSPTAVLVKYTLLGDANLDGIVNTLDFNALATNYGTTSANWVQGDATYDGTVNSDDFDKIAANFGGTVAALGAALPDSAVAMSSLGTVVPEPIGFSMIALAGVGMMQRRRRA